MKNKGGFLKNKNAGELQPRGFIQPFESTPGLVVNISIPSRVDVERVIEKLSKLTMERQ